MAEITEIKNVFPDGNEFLLSVDLQQENKKMVLLCPKPKSMLCSYRIPLILFFSFFLFQFSIDAQDINKIDLGGKWKFRQEGLSKWNDADVPGCVHLDLMKNGIISDPYYRDNENFVQWIGNTGWEYKKTFLISDTLFKYRHIELVSKGLDTYASVYLNDSLIISADNMFMDWFANIKPILRIGANTIRVVFPSVVKENADRYQKLPYKLPGDEKVVCRKAAYHFGWDWGPTLITSGIWKPVYIRYWNFVNVRSVQYIQKKLTDSVAIVSAVMVVTSDVPDIGTFRITENSNLLAEERISLSSGINVVRFDFSISNPRKWWPNGLGEPYLYPLQHEVVFAGRIVGKGTTNIGLRTIRLIQQLDSTGRSFYFKLNDVPVFMKGANYIPQDNFLSRVTDSAYRELIQSAVQANMNMLRVWGGGVYEKDIFYDLCDQYGILVWQDFMFANAMYPGTPEFIKSVQGEVTQQIVRLRNHPCIALWCGNNEIEEGWKNWGWSKQYKYSTEDSTQIWRNYLTTFGPAITSAVSRFDTLRPYIMTSPRHGWGRKESLTEGDMHYWGVWWGKAPFENYEKNTGRFMSEYGFQGFPSLTTLNKITLPADRELNSPVLKSHQKHPTGFELIDEYMNRDYRKPKNFESYAYVSQLLQAAGMKTAIEAHRRAKPYCMGTLFWQFNDCWPVISWSAMDYYGMKKAFFYDLKKEFATVLVSAVTDSGYCKIFVVSDSLMSFQANLNLTLLDFHGKSYFKKVIPVNSEKNSSQLIFQSKISDILSTNDLTSLVLSMELVSGNKTIAKNLKYFVPVKDLKLPRPLIRKSVRKIDSGYLITLSTDKLAKDIMLSTTVKGEYSDNYFDLLPGEEVHIGFRTKIQPLDFIKSLKVQTLIDSYE